MLVMNGNNRVKFTKSKFAAHLGLNRSWWQYYNDYTKVVDEIIDGVIENKYLIDEVALPLLFMINHSIELGLKANIYELEKVNFDIEKISLKSSQGHSLEYLYKKFIEHIECIQNKIILQ